jgi:hypothetical protein
MAHGINTVLGGPGADTVRADDGVVQAIDCGDDVDQFTADTRDMLTACETNIGPPPPVHKDPADPSKPAVKPTFTFAAVKKVVVVARGRGAPSRRLHGTEGLLRTPAPARGQDDARRRQAQGEGFAQGDGEPPGPALMRRRRAVKAVATWTAPKGTTSSKLVTLTLTRARARAA